jgi:HPt (histidine-containing phosphotransfer) domain-containing protein
VDEILEELLPKPKGHLPTDFFYEKGLDNFDGNDAGYRETMVLFADLWMERREQLKQFMDENNMADYAILIHAVKGDARTLGAVGLGELAYEQELRAKAGDTDSIRSTFDKVIGEGDIVAEYFKQMYS